MGAEFYIYLYMRESLFQPKRKAKKQSWHSKIKRAKANHTSWKSKNEDDKIPKLTRIHALDNNKFKL